MIPVEKKRGRGRPVRKNTDARKNKIVETLAAGNYRTVAARAAGIAYDTLAEWCRTDPVFSARCAEAEANAEIRAVGEIVKDSPLEFLARKHYKRWGRRDRVQAEVTLRASELTDEQLAARIAALKAKLLA